MRIAIQLYFILTDFPTFRKLSYRIYKKEKKSVEQQTSFLSI
ncbi:hypothetical protein HMPREF9422_0142 [Streptococcus cristatus ATCC 51100]|uniref:Uncharacterized protein n=1 Tax=Streptococcus cristatus ATCC 51100 TaxID=889201 RepID=A0AAV3EEY2_STRCR|nr:hypothetical protein HMPREF9422_0142 [Streptococcus cristatus ATCC 51100]EGU67966.1 hypothetical protein HMPREF9960_1877 [Streptococcus cristatus ATCC 51100]